MAGGADAAYIFEEKFNIQDLQKDVYHMATKMSEGVQRGLVIRNENANENYTTDFVYRLYAEEGKGLFSARSNYLGHIQQGGAPTPFDRNLGTKMASKAVNWLSDTLRANTGPDGNVARTKADTTVLLGIEERNYKFTPVSELEVITDFKYVLHHSFSGIINNLINFFRHRIPQKQWWLRLRPLLRILAKHDSVYEDDGVYLTLEAHEKKNI